MNHKHYENKLLVNLPALVRRRKRRAPDPEVRQETETKLETPPEVK